MTCKTICCIRRSAAISHAMAYLSDSGLPVAAYPTGRTGYLLLPVPSFPHGQGYLEELLPQLPKGTVICGGNLDVPMLNSFPTIDFLKDPYYLAQNAAITARCAISIVRERTEVRDCPVLILGWGRIGKCLWKFLSDQGARVTVAARKDGDLAIAQALGCGIVPIGAVEKSLSDFRVILNTIPAMVLPEMETEPGTILLELASVPGMAGENIISAQGLPGLMAPEESGKLIANTFLRLLWKEEPI